MTPQQLRKAARALCELRGKDPDNWVAHPDNQILGGQKTFEPQYVWFEHEILTHFQIHQAIQIGMEP